MQRLYLDTEFNGFHGNLVSLALAAPDGEHWYEVLPYPKKWESWVADNVVPHLGKKPIPPEQFGIRLRTYLQARPGCTIYADWPTDFEHLLAVMRGEHYADFWQVECQMVLLTGTDPQSVVPHNALSDAIALMEWHQATLLQPTRPKLSRTADRSSDKTS